MRRVGTSLLLALACATALPAVVSADAADCQGIEAALRSAIEGAAPTWTQEQKDTYVRNGAASCWEEVRRAEEIEAQQDAEVREAIQREEAERTQRESERREERRIQQQIEDEEMRRRLREARRHEREWARKPTVTRATAREFARRLMNESDFTIWRVDCAGGRIDRTHWRCRVKIFYHCLRGRIRVAGVGFKDRRPYFQARGSELWPCRI